MRSIYATMIGAILPLTAIACGCNTSLKRSAEPTSSSVDSNSPKRGVAYHFCGWPMVQGPKDLAAMSPSLKWYYNWSSRPLSCDDGKSVQTDPLITDGTVEFVPMAWGLVNGGADCDSGGPCFRVDDRDGGTQCPEICSAGDWSFRADGPCYACYHEIVSRDVFVTDVPDSARYLLGFNEPNFKEQANLTPKAAAKGWRHVEFVAQAKQLKVVGPAVNFCDPTPGADHAGACIEAVDGSPMLGFAWLEKFYDECSVAGVAARDCQVDYQALHAYSCGSVAWMVSQAKRKAGLMPATRAHCENGRQDKDEFGTDCGGNNCVACSTWARAQFAKPVWMTEFAPPKDACGNPDPSTLEAQTVALVRRDLPTFDADPYVFRYAWFMPRSDLANLAHVDLVSGDHEVTLTPVGRTYFGSE